MPTAAAALKLKKIRRRFGITASSVVVRSHMPWQWLALAAIVFCSVLGALVWLVRQGNEAGLMERELDSLRQQIAEQKDELSLLRSKAGTGQNAVSIERAAQQQLLAELQRLERENAALKEDILLFERLIPLVGNETGVRVENFRVTQEALPRYRYRLLLAFQPAKQSPEFRGRLQLAITFVLAGKEQQLLLPEKRGVVGDFQLEIKHFLRREGAFELPPGAELKAVEVRVLQGDTLMAKRLAQL